MPSARSLALGSLAALLLAGAAARAGDAPFMSLRSDKVYLREGPTYQHRVLWEYRRKGYPLEVIDTYQGWRRVRDEDGTTGWVSAVMLSQLRTVVVTGHERAAIAASPGIGAKVIAWAEPGVVAEVKACKPRFCEVSSGDVEGWIDKNKIWGVRAGEVFQ